MNGLVVQTFCTSPPPSAFNNHFQELDIPSLLDGFIDSLEQLGVATDSSTRLNSASRDLASFLMDRACVLERSVLVFLKVRLIVPVVSLQRSFCSLSVESGSVEAASGSRLNHFRPAPV